MRERLRVVIAPRPATGWWNMAVDEVLLAGAREAAAPTLRLYAWSGPWLSLGYAQPFGEGALRACRSAGVRVVRRITGGRAVLHGADLTYSISAPEAALPPTLEGSYRLVSEALLAALRELGIDAAPAPRAAATRDFDCFAAAATDEICAGGRKLVGSAQRRAGGAVLQHGSIRLAPDPAQAAHAAGLGKGATSLLELGIDVARARTALAGALPLALAELLAAKPEPAPLTPRERAAARARARSLQRSPLGGRGVSASRAR
jgi:lipoate-protein ligase A